MISLDIESQSQGLLGSFGSQGGVQVVAMADPPNRARPINRPRSFVVRIFILFLMRGLLMVDCLPVLEKFRVGQPTEQFGLNVG